MAATIKLKISIKSGAVLITSSNGKKGGNVRARVLRRIVWECQHSGAGKVDSFDLQFERLDDDEGAVQASADWPFMEAKAEPEDARIDEHAGTVGDATRFGGRLVDAGVYKYSVTAYAGGESYALDPIIIVQD